MIEEEKLRKLINDGFTRAQMAEHFNCSKGWISKILKKYNINLFKFKVIHKGVCKTCNKYLEYSSINPKEINYCSRSCANTRIHSDETKKKIRETLIQNGYKPNKFCNQCGIDIGYKVKKSKYCSISCAKIFYMNSEEGRKTLKKMIINNLNSQQKRSKNEVELANMCKSVFNNVLTNTIMFNGWDADIILPDYKIAILWNGVWHYKKITKYHSLEQVQNRDKIKMKEMIKLGYEPYIIKDMGRFSLKKVELEFFNLINHINKKKENN